MMNVERLDHVHIKVKDLNKAVKLFSNLMGSKWLGPINLDKYGVRTSFDTIGFEMLEPTGPDTALARDIEKRGEGVMSIGLKVTNLDEAVKHFEANGVRCTMRAEQGNVRAATFHPKDAFGVSFELVEYPDWTSVGLANLARMSEIPSNF